MSKLALVLAVLAACHEAPSKAEECAEIKVLAAKPREHANFIFQHLAMIPWHDPELKKLVDYATGAGGTPEDRANPPYMWDATVLPRLEKICAF